MEAKMDAKTKSGHEKRTAKTKKKILKAAVTIAKKNGCQEVNIRNICTAAGISIGAFYHHYGTKEKLIQEVFALFEEEYLTEIPNEVTKLGKWKTIEWILTKYTRYGEEEIGPFMAEYFISALNHKIDSIVSKDRIIFRILYEKTKEALDSERFHEEYEAEELTQLFLSFVHGKMMDWCLNGENYNLTESVQKEFGILLRGILKKEVTKNKKLDVYLL